MDQEEIDDEIRLRLLRVLARRENVFFKERVPAFVSLKMWTDFGVIQAIIKHINGGFKVFKKRDQFSRTLPSVYECSVKIPDDSDDVFYVEMKERVNGDVCVGLRVDVHSHYGPKRLER
ncbi:MAG: hypothetical protein WC047_07815 [Kiritimatiellales bacterium]